MYKVGDKVQIKSREWFKNNKDHSIQNQYSSIVGFYIRETGVFFNEKMFEYCDKTFEIVDITERISEEVYILNTNNTFPKWFWSKNMIISLKKLRKKKLNKLKNKCIK